MIEAVLICDKCYRRSEPVTAREVDTYEYTSSADAVEIPEPAGWYLCNGEVYCPDHERERRAKIEADRQQWERLQYERLAKKYGPNP